MPGRWRSRRVCTKVCAVGVGRMAVARRAGRPAVWLADIAVITSEPEDGAAGDAVSFEPTPRLALIAVIIFFRARSRPFTPHSKPGIRAAAFMVQRHANGQPRVAIKRGDISKRLCKPLK